MTSRTNPVIVGAGISGLMCALELARNGVNVLVIDKGRSVGGRLATRRIGHATVDHGAQFFTVRTQEFEQIVKNWLDTGLVYEWCKGFNPQNPDGHPRYAVRWGMNALAKHLATEIQTLGGSIRCNARVDQINHDVDQDVLSLTVMGNARNPLANGRAADVDNGDSWSITTQQLVLTAPVPQSLALLQAGGITLSSDTQQLLDAIVYQPAIAALITLDGDSALVGEGQCGAAQLPPETHGDFAVSFVADNHAKGISTTTALTVHATPQWSKTHFEDDPESVLAQLVEYGSCWYGRSRVVDAQLKLWRYALPTTTVDHRFVGQTLGVNKDTNIVFAGDAFGGPRIEGAALSGLAAARQLLG